MNYCSVPNCLYANCRFVRKRRKDGGQIAFFMFPLNPYLRKAWLIFIGSAPGEKNINENSRICSEHFTDNDFDMDGPIMKLKPYSVPSRNPPNVKDSKLPVFKVTTEQSNTLTNRPTLTSTSSTTLGHQMLIGNVRPQVNVLNKPTFTPMVIRPPIVTPPAPQNEDSYKVAMMSEILSALYPNPTATNQQTNKEQGDLQIVENNAKPKVKERPIRPRIKSRVETGDFSVQVDKPCNHKGSDKFYNTLQECIKQNCRLQEQLKEKQTENQKLSRELNAYKGNKTSERVKAIMAAAKDGALHALMLWELISHFGNSNASWHPEIVKHCSNWKQFSEEGYEYARKNGILMLPTKNALCPNKRKSDSSIKEVEQNKKNNLKTKSGKKLKKS